MTDGQAETTKTQKRNKQNQKSLRKSELIIINYRKKILKWWLIDINHYSKIIDRQIDRQRQRCEKSTGSINKAKLLKTKQKQNKIISSLSRFMPRSYLNEKKTKSKQKTKEENFKN